MRLRSWLVIFLLCLVSTFLAGCGGAATTPEPEQATAVTTAASPTPAASTPVDATAAATVAASPTVGPQGEGTSDTGQVATLCATDEEIILSCQIAGSDKVLSVCASSDLAQSGYIQYRFGSQENVELLYPETLTPDVLQAFRYTRSTGSGTDYIYLSFEEEDYIFRVYQMDKNGERVAGVDVRDPDGQLTDFPCDAARVEKLRILEQLVPEGMAGDESTEVPASELGTVVVTFGEEPPSEMPVVYLHEVNTGAFYKESMPIGPGPNQVMFEVKPGNYQVYAHSTVFEDIAYWGFWKEGGSLEVIAVEAGKENTQPTLTAPVDACARAYQLPPTPDAVYLATDAPDLASKRGCP